MMYYSFDGKVVNTTLYPDYHQSKYIYWREVEKNPPVLYTRKEECCGCYACYSACIKEAIVLEEDLEGFVYPIVNLSKCICCYKCESVCPIKSKSL